MHSSELARLYRDLKTAGFAVAILNGQAFRNEDDLLKGLGSTLAFPSHYGVNWDAFADCVGDLAHQGGNIALVWTAADVFSRRNLHGFVRAVHLLLSATSHVNTVEIPFQLEVFVVGEHEGFKNGPAP